MKTPNNEDSIDNLCRHLNLLQMEFLTHFLRKNAAASGDKSGSFRRLQDAIFKNFVEACKPQDHSRDQNDTKQ